ncbi:hypothetical protein [Bradyrhizobium sp. AUGA SZCCT0042]|uniref:hypothetical protein n=1 Tax=Bradyrhizobium sp. AUGA SZCCT0042 TaxID=2807651 RepID=UPI001BA91BA5|nr:hypothetical protein [Bradyrhizobium sp. AUGA SZCCT0042]MBR1301245.1 hypothetical protein [Bradyrhizobium sp. AUGA SZCCT0042]
MRTMMFSQGNAGDDAIFSICETPAEVYLIVQHLHGLDAVETMLADRLPSSTREGLKRDADDLARVGVKPLASLVRRYARQARPAPERHWWTIADGAKRSAAFVRQGGEERRRSRADKLF